MKYKHHIMNLITLLLITLWIPVALDKLWDLQGFHRTLLRQPFPEWWADVLYWLLPILELACALLLVGGVTRKVQTDKLKTAQIQNVGFALSSVLMLGFTLFILFGALGWYDKRPCGCGSVISGLSWEQHLRFNVVFLLISMLGWWWSGGGRSGGGGQDGPKRSAGSESTGHPVGPENPATDTKRSNLLALAFRRSYRLRYPRKFALFPGRPARSIELVPSAHSG